MRVGGRWRGRRISGRWWRGEKGPVGLLRWYEGMVGCRRQIDKDILAIESLRLYE